MPKTRDSGSITAASGPDGHQKESTTGENAVRGAGNAGWIAAEAMEDRNLPPAAARAPPRGGRAVACAAAAFFFSPTGWPCVAGGQAILRARPPERTPTTGRRLQACSIFVTRTARGSRLSACKSINDRHPGGGGLRPSPPATHDQAFGLQGAARQVQTSGRTSAAAAVAVEATNAPAQTAAGISAAHAANAESTSKQAGRTRTTPCLHR
jgi:hypothetical protein